MKRGQLCEFAGCMKPAVVQGKIGHPFEDRWLCQECHDNPLGVTKETEIQRINRKIEEKRKFLREMQREIRGQIAEHENEIKQVIFDGLKTYELHPKLALDRKMLGKNSEDDFLAQRRSEIETPEYLVLGTWTCIASPTGSCVYDKINDPVQDCCIFCGEPEERK